MTRTDPRPELAAMLAERLAPAAAALAGACAEDIPAAPPPEDDRALAERHRAGRAALRAPFVTPDGAPAPIRGPAPVLAAAPAAELALHRLRRHREPWMDPGSSPG